MKKVLILIFMLAGLAQGQMEMRDNLLYRRSMFRERAPAVGKLLTDLTLRNLEGKKVALSSLKDKPLIIIGGAYT